MKSSAKTVAFAAFFLCPALAVAAPNDAFKAPAGKTTAAPGAITNPGLWFTLKNTCPGEANAAVADNVCLLAIDSAVFMTKLRDGVAPKGLEDTFDICADKSGNGQIMFVPPAGKAFPAQVITVKPNSVVTYPTAFCKK